MPSANRRDFLKTTAAVGAADDADRRQLRHASTGPTTASASASSASAAAARPTSTSSTSSPRTTRASPPSPSATSGTASKRHYKEPTAENGTYLQGLYPSAKKVGLNPDDKKHVVKDYRRLLDLPEVDVVCIATPDHWHAKMSIDAAVAGKDVYCEKPMTKTIDEAHAVVDAMQKHNRVMTVGVQSMADPRWREANDLIKTGEIGHVAQAQTSYYRNSIVGQWRYYRLWKEHESEDDRLGHVPRPQLRDQRRPAARPGPEEMPFDRAVFAQWRCYWPFGGGMFTDLFVHQTTHMISAMGVRYPARVVGGGGLYLEYDGRDVPDVATIVADYDEGCQLVITATMINDYPIEEVIRGHLATVRFTKRDRKMGYEVLPQELESAAAPAGRKSPARKGRRTARRIPGPRHDAGIVGQLPRVRPQPQARDAIARRNWGRPRSRRCRWACRATARARCCSGTRSSASRSKPTPSWAARWEARSKKHGKPNQIAGWHGDEKGSTLHAEDYQKLGGPWIHGQDPAEKA